MTSPFQKPKVGELVFRLPGPRIGLQLDLKTALQIMTFTTYLPVGRTFISTLRDSGENTHLTSEEWQ